MCRITENTIEEFAIELLKRLGYQYICAPDIAHDASTNSATGNGPERNSYEDVLLVERLQNAIRRINPKVPIDSLAEALKEIQRINSPELLANNEAFHRMLTEGINVSYQSDGQDRGDLVWLIDFKSPENNEFIVANQFTVIENGNNKRPDVILFVNGIPLVVIELKNFADENATVKSAFKQIETYKSIIPSLFNYNAFNIISDGLEEFISISASQATTMGHIKRGDLYDAIVLAPSLDEIKEFTEIQAPIIDKIIVNNKQLKKLIAMRDTLLPITNEWRSKGFNR